MNQTITSKRKVKFYGRSSWYFALALLIIIVGFYKSYITQIKNTDLSHHLHGTAALLWMLLLIIQPLLINKNGIKWHRWLGWASMVLVPWIVLSGLRMVQTMVLSKATYPPLAPYQLGFIDFFSLAQFLLFYTMAIVTRRNMQLHARYMAATVFIFLIPGLGRMLMLFPPVDSIQKMVNISYVLVEIALIILLFDDKRKGKMRLPYVLALCLFAVQHIVDNFIMNFAWWQHLLDSYAKL